jgi:hypothetical protein
MVYDFDSFNVVIFLFLIKELSKDPIYNFFEFLFFIGIKIDNLMKEGNKSYFVGQRLIEELAIDVNERIGFVKFG